MVDRRLWQAVRWFYPGMRVKRWVVLALVSSGCIIFSLLELIGKERISRVYRILTGLPWSWSRPLVITGLIFVGIIGFSIGIMGLVRSVTRGMAPGKEKQSAEIIYRTRVLERGPSVVALGGGTGLSTLLRGLKEETSNLTAVVTVMDDGGSSGRLRSELDVLPPGDIRNCILALAEDEERISRFLQHRFQGAPGLEGHSLGNLLLVGIEQATGGFDRAIEEMSFMLNIRGQVLPATLAKTHLVAQMEDGEWIEGESRITTDPRQVRKITLSNENVTPYERVLDAIARADLILLGPGSLFTSLIPNLLVAGIAPAIEKASAEKFYIANLMTQPGETDGFTLRDHLRVLSTYIDLHRFDGLIANTVPPDVDLLSRYRQESAEPVADDLESNNEYGLQVIRGDLLGTTELEGKQTVKHDPRKLAHIITHHARAFSHKRINP
jgi:uncharacterized cofD-like protein